MRSLYAVIKSPLVTEKSTRISPNRQYAFWVDINSNKIEIKKAIEKLYSVKVDRVASMIVKGKMKKVKWNQPGRTTDWKKAIVTLKNGFEIKLT